MVAIGLEASPEAVVAQERVLDWVAPARFLGEVACPTLLVHGESGLPVPLELAAAIADAMRDALLVVIPAGGHRPDIRSPELVNPLLLDFLLVDPVLP